MELGEKKKLKPASAGLVVCDPVGGTLPAEGREVVISTYWLRRVNDGSAVAVEETKEKPAPEKAAKK